MAGPGVLPFAFKQTLCRATAAVMAGRQAGGCAALGSRKAQNAYGLVELLFL